MIRRVLLTAVVLGGVSALVGGCGGDSGTNGDLPDPFNTVRLDLYTVAPLGDAMMYELWAVPNATELTASDSAWVSLGKFSVIRDGDDLLMLDAAGNPIPDNTITIPKLELKEYDSLFVTVEPFADTDTLPSASVYLAGDIDFDLSSFVNMGFPDQSLSNLNDNARFTFATPTDADTDSLNELAGVWFMLAGGQQQGLFGLATAMEGWVYQGWVQYHVTEPVEELHVLTTGRFTGPVGEDMDAPYSAADNPPPGFPGEDFVENSPSVNLTFPSGPPENVWITVEPYPDPDPATPFPYMIYEMQSGQTPDIQQNFLLDTKDESNGGFPKAMARIFQEPS